MSCQVISIRATDRLPGEEAGRAEAVETLCAFLVEEARRAGATGAKIEDVAFRKLSDGTASITVALRIVEGAGFEEVDAARCRAWLEEKRAARVGADDGAQEEEG